MSAPIPAEALQLRSRVKSDQILADLAPAQRQELGELVLIRIAGDAAADDDVRGEALVPYRAPADRTASLTSGAANERVPHYSLLSGR